jgi:signal transduction histidine kinase
LLQEFSEMLSAKVRPLAKEAGVRFESVRVGDGTLLNREANLLSLVLYNLVQNAIQATPPDKLVTLRISAGGGRIVCEVQDEGPGISEAQRAQLFKPCRSTKEGGSGIGLAISQQLAKCIGAKLELKETAPTGSRFVLTFPNGDVTGTEADGRGAREEPASSNPTSYSAQV